MEPLSKINTSSNSISEQSNEEEDELESKMVFERALENFKNEAFKKTISYIKSVTLIENTFYYWQILYLQLCSYQEIIQKKLLKYYSSTKLISVEKYFNIFDKEIQTFIKYIQQESIYNKDDIYFPNPLYCYIVLPMENTTLQSHDNISNCQIQS